MAEHILAFTTLGSEEDAAKLARELVERRIVACVNLSGPVRSFYRWKGNLEDDREYLLLMKTRTERFSDLEDVLQELHPYDVPELIAVPITLGSAAYLGWVDENVGR
jgi:periplasmic divalent cation tolerance protein